MKKSQIKELAQAAVKYDSIEDKDLNWIFSNFSRKDLKLFAHILEREIKNKNVLVSHAGDIRNEERERITSMFPDKKISFKRDDENLGGGLRIEYGYFTLDYSVSGIIGRIINNIRENL